MVTGGGPDSFFPCGAPVPFVEKTLLYPLAGPGTLVVKICRVDFWGAYFQALYPQPLRLLSAGPLLLTEAQPPLLAERGRKAVCEDTRLGAQLPRCSVPWSRLSSPQHSRARPAALQPSRSVRAPAVSFSGQGLFHRPLWCCRSLLQNGGSRVWGARAAIPCAGLGPLSRVVGKCEHV